MWCHGSRKQTTRRRIRAGFGPGTDRVTKERRKFKRVIHPTRCWCEGKESTLYVNIRDLSVGGLFIRTSTPFHPGEHVTVRWSFRKEEEEHTALIQVVWKREVEPLPGMGLKFLSVSDETVGILRQIAEKDDSERPPAQ